MTRRRRLSVRGLKPLHRRSGFLPTIGAILILVAGGLRSGEWIEVAAESLTVAGLFLIAQRRKSVDALYRADEPSR